MQYHLFWDYIPVVRRIVRHYGWKKVKLIGHSMGGALCFMYAACFPDEVSQFTSIDLYGPPVRDLNKNAMMTGFGIDKLLDYETLRPSKIPCHSYDEMVQIALDAHNGSIDRKSAEILMIRGMKEAPKTHSKDGYYFARDLRLKVSLLGLFSFDQVAAYAACIKCHVLNIKAVPGYRHDNPEMYSKVLDEIRKSAPLEYHEVLGTHHLHLTTPERVAPIIGAFLLNPDTDADADDSDSD